MRCAFYMRYEISILVSQVAFWLRSSIEIDHLPPSGLLVISLSVTPLQNLCLRNRIVSHNHEKAYVTLADKKIEITY